MASGEGPGKVSITYTLKQGQKRASNQIAVWIEDEKGNYVKSIFATRFTANGGYKSREQALPDWRKASDWGNAPQSEVDAVSGATQSQGVTELVWDCTDRKGNPVAPGTYTYKIEGNIAWENRVIWQGKITVGGQKNASTAEATFTPPDAAEKGNIVEDVKAVYEPST
jgi:hypothetical protein